MLNFLARLSFAATQSRSDVVRLIEADPSGWTFTGYWAVHRESGIKVWVASSPSFLHLELPGNLPDWTPGWAERRLIWNALESHKRAAADRAARKAVKLVRDAAEAAELKADRA